MRIGMILDAPFPPDYRVEKEAMSLAAAGHEVFLFCLDYERKYCEEDYKGIKLRRYPSNKLVYKFSALAYTVPVYRWVMAARIDDFVRRNSLDVIHVHDMVIAEAAMSVAGKYKLKVVLDLHENRPAIMREYRHLKKFPGKYLIDLSVWEVKQKELVAKADKVVVVTDLAKQELVTNMGKPEDDIVVLPNTPSISFASYPLKDELVRRMKPTFNLLYIGDTSERRGTTDMLHAVASLRNEIPNLALWIIGNSSFDFELKQKAAELEVTDFVHFEGWQSESLFPSYISGAHICLSPLKRNLHHDTTFANKIFQYMSMGKPSVVSNCTAQAELIQQEKAGLVYDAGKPGDLERAIRILYNDPGQRNEFGQCALNAVRSRWSWEKSSQALIDLYRNGIE